MASNVVVEIRYNHIPKMRGELPSTVKAVIGKITGDLETLIKQSMDPPKHGRMYGDHQASAPGEPPAIDLSNLVNSIDHDFEDDGATGVVFTDVEYGPHLEYGTSKMAARPFMRPGAEKIRKPFAQAMRQAIERWTP